MIFLYLLTYLSTLVFLILVIKKIYQYSSAPVHVRWELYPVAHEPERNKYGGSYYEEVEWWKKKQEKNHLAEIWAMMEEIVFLKGVYVHNRKLWYFSFPFHLGLYFITGTTMLLFISGLLSLMSVIDIALPQSGLELILHNAINIFGYAGLALTFGGCIGLIIQRVSDSKFKFYNTPMDFINLFFILILVISVFLTLILSNSSFIMSKEFVRNLLSFNFLTVTDSLFIAHIILISLFLLYFPITRMMHLFAKYFLYHDVRWQDDANVKGGKLEKKVREALNFGVSWSAPHIQKGKTWAEVATTLPEKEGK